jgi:hypothetical protein
MMRAPSLNQQTETLRETNQRLNFWLESLLPDHGEPVVATPQQMMGLLSELLRAGEWLRTGLPADRDPELEMELEVYRNHVKRLHRLLPSIHSRLLQEKARLESERSRVEASAQWARASRQTF